MNKSYNDRYPSAVNEISAEDMKLINGYSRKELSPEELFTFSVLLCDNEIDRDFERFSSDALKGLAELFVGKTAIKNHSCSCDDQSARTYKTEVVTDPERRNSLGEPYSYLKAYCYMPRIPKNEDFIREIEAGIKKEVSVGCSVSKSVCSICGSNRKQSSCQHRKGKTYKGKLCFDELSEPCDAYEWSFVAVPAQRNAGVIKGFNYDKENDMTDIIKRLETADGSVTLSREEALSLYDTIGELRDKAADGEIYRAQLEADTVKLFALTMPNLVNGNAHNICRALSTKDLRELNEGLKAGRKSVNAPELYTADSGDGAQNNSQFRL